ncbi:MAG: tetratricopeptide repeat protein [Acidobacteria bacterium]|nr:tetratricopeptide repeat protein [Acidobacteriota bacterium]
MTTKLENEVALLERYNHEIETLGDQLAEVDPRQSKPMQQELERKLEIYRKQIELVKTHFPDSADGRIHEAALYTFQAITRFHSVGFFRRQAASRNSLTMALIARQQEKGNAQEALALLDKALSVFDYPGAHFGKAIIFQALKQKENALRELNYIINNFADDNVYVSAREMKDEIENPPKSGGCFIATAVYGAPFAPELTTFYRLRDEVMLSSMPGRAFVRVYYAISPPMARWISRSSFLRAATRRLVLDPLAQMIKVVYRF